MPLNDRQTRFVAEYLIDLNASQAAIRAGYSPINANVTGPRLLSDVRIAAAVAAGKTRQLQTADISAVRVLEELRRLATVDLRSFFDEDGNFKRIQDLTPEQGAALAGFEVVKKNAEAGDGKVDVIHKFKVWDKPRSLEMLAKHFGLLVERMEISGKLSLPDRLTSARDRIRRNRESAKGAK